MLEPTYSTDSFTPASRRGPYRTHDYFALPDEPRCELLFGRFYVVPSPDVSHQQVVGAIFLQLSAAARRTGGQAFVAPLDVVLERHSVVQPDVMYVSPQRRDIVRQRLEGAPDLVVEVLSLGTARRDHGAKLLAYAEAGVLEYWIVDPAAQRIEFLVNDGGTFKVVVPRSNLYRSAAVDGIRLDIARVWPDLMKRAHRGSREKYLAALARVPDVEPRVEDRVHAPQASPRAERVARATTRGKR